jgi:hypothetical protein
VQQVGSCSLGAIGGFVGMHTHCRVYDQLCMHCQLLAAVAGPVSALLHVLTPQLCFVLT